MNLRLNRFEFTDKSTIGQLFVDDRPFCFVLEDVDRKLEDDPKGKIYGQTAIPRGTYQIILDYSGRFEQVLPRLLDVPGYKGVRIHPGNNAENTEGCLLPGATWRKDWVGNSRTTFERLFEQMEDAEDRGEPMEITVA